MAAFGATADNYRWPVRRPDLVALVKSAKCQGLGAGIPDRHGNAQKPGESFFLFCPMRRIIIFASSEGESDVESAQDIADKDFYRTFGRKFEGALYGE